MYIVKIRDTPISRDTPCVRDPTTTGRIMAH